MTSGFSTEKKKRNRGSPCDEIVALSEFLVDKQCGVFVDIGAGNGYVDNKSFYLEYGFNWTGICVENTSKFSTLEKSRRCITKKAYIDKETNLSPNILDIRVDDADIVDKVNSLGEIMLAPCYRLVDILSENSITVVDCLFINQRFATKIYDILSGIDFGKVLINIFIFPRLLDDTAEEDRIESILTILKYDVYARETAYWIFVRQTLQFSFD
jgi:hypothetical protein